MFEDALQSLRQADPNIYKAATRAAQLQSVKPIVAYWCDYWVLKQILAKGLHTSNPDILDYSTHLMDKLEQVKAEHASEEALTDDTIGQAYVEQFAQETLDRAQRVVRANKVTAQTANTFDAGATFFGLVNIWGTPDQETLQKIKYAKWNATRILKALKEGKDPNESNPKPDELPAPDADDVDNEAIASPSSQSARGPRPVTIEDEPDSDSPRRDSAGISLPHSPVTDPAKPVLPSASPTAPSVPQTWVPTPSPPVEQPAVFLPPPPSDTPATFLPPLPQAQPSVPDPDVVTPDAFYQPQPHRPSSPPHVPAVYAPPPQVPAPAPAPAPTPSAVTGFPPTAYRPAPQPAPVRAPVAPVAVDDMAMAGAQKHAKWAISALNFEDVPTAVRELRKALELLGAS